MYETDYNKKNFHASSSNNGDIETGPRTRSSVPVTPKMLVKALKKLQKVSLNRDLFTSREVTCQILSMYPAVEQDAHALLLEVTDKLMCAAAAGLLGTRRDLGYFAHNQRQEGMSVDSKSELMFWLYYKKLLKKKNEKRAERELNRGNQISKGRPKGKKVFRFMSFTDDHLHFFPLVQYRRRIKKAP